MLKFEKHIHEGTASFRAKTTAELISISETEMKNELRGKVRDITLDDLSDAIDYDEPTFIRRKQAVGESGGSTYRGYRGIVMDNTDLNDLDVPTFLRRKAD